MKKDIKELINEIVSRAKSRGIIKLITEDERYNGRTIILRGKEVLNFGSSSYLGLELDERLKQAAMNAIARYGLQYSSSRAYVSSTPYAELEDLMSKIFKNPIALAPSTTLGHQAVIPVVIDPDDAVILDQQVHSSVQYPTLHLQLVGVKVTIIRHNNLIELEQKIQELIVKHSRVWYMVDSVYSMYGDVAPLGQLEGLLNKYKQLYLYVDDAHGMSWAGENGSGYALSKIKMHPKMIIASSLNKGFAAGGSVFVIPDEALCEKVKNCGGPFIFSGQHQISALGSGIETAKIHLSPEIYELQARLKEKIDFCQALLESYNLPYISDPETPIFFIGLGLIKVGYNLVERLINEGCFVNLSIFPAVPETCSGLRFSVTLHHTLEDITYLVERLAYHFPKALKEEGRTYEEVSHAFRKVKKIGMQSLETNKREDEDNTFTIRYENSIRNIDEDLWNNLISKDCSMDWNGLLWMEEVFQNNEKTEDNWKFHYYIVYDENNEVIIATYFTSALLKDDLLAPALVSMQVEKERLKDPYYLCTRSFLMGCLFSIGKHLYIKRSHKAWKEALTLLLNQVNTHKKEEEASVLNLRDFDPDDTELCNFLLDASFIKIALPDNHVINNSKWQNDAEYLGTLSSKDRNYVKRKAIEYEKFYDIRIVRDITEEELDLYYKLYMNVKEKNFELNAFLLPKALFKTVCNNKHCELIELKIKPQYNFNRTSLTIGFAMSFKTKDYYSTLLVGLDYNYLEEYATYMQLLWQVIKRTNQLGLDRLELGLTTSLNKKRFGAKRIKHVAYIQSEDQYAAMIINSIPNSEVLFEKASEEVRKARITARNKIVQGILNERNHKKRKS